MERLQSLDNTQTLSNLYMIRQTIDKNDKVTQSKFDDLLKKFYPEKWNKTLKGRFLSYNLGRHS